MKTIHVQYYAVLREARGCADETVKTAAATAGDLYDELKERHGFRLRKELVKAAIDGEVRGWKVVLKTGDHVAFLPPVAGG